MFLSAVWTHSDGTHLLQVKFSKMVPMKKQAYLQLGWPKGESFSANLHFWVN